MEGFNIIIINMSLLSAGKQISVGNDKSYGRGLFIADPDQAERRARKQQKYQQELRLQMEEDRRRKQQRKRKEAEQDMRLEQKIKEEMRKQNEKKTQKSPPKNDKNFQMSQVKSQVTMNDYSKVQAKERRPEQTYNYKFQLHMQTEGGSPSQNNPYLPRNFDLVQAEQQRFFDQSNNQKLRVMHEVLQQKLNQVYKRIKQSQDLEIDKQFQMIRRKIFSSNNNYETENFKAQELQGQISHFYRIPKKSDAYQSRASESRAPKNLNYDSNSYMKRTDNLYKPVTQQKTEYSRPIESRESGQSNGDRLWGAKKGKNNYLGNREAMDYQINNIMGKIDNLLEDPGYGDN